MKRKIRIGILTFARSNNYGAFLQCYSLLTKFKELSYDVRVINYSMPLVEIGFFVHLMRRGVKKGLSQLAIFRKSANENLQLTKKMISSNLKKSIQFLNSLEFDLIVAGSDEIWKINRFRHYPNIYWISTSLKSKKISYAASANRTYVTNIPTKTIQDMRRELKNYLYLGVRDKHTKDFLEDINIDKEIFDNCDPTFIYNNVNTPLLKNKLVEKYKIDLDKPILGLVSGNKEVGFSLRKNFSKEFQIVSITNNNPYADFYLYDLDPFEWANVFKYFDCCVTSYFHGMVFAIKSNVPFIAFDSEKFSISHSTKILDLINKYELDSCYVNIQKEPIEIISEKLKINQKNRNVIINKIDEINISEIKKWKLFEDKLFDIFSQE